MESKKLARILTEVCMKEIIKSAHVLFFLLLHASVVCLGTIFFVVIFGKVIDLNYCSVCELTYEESLICYNLFCGKSTDELSWFIGFLESCVVAMCCHRRPRSKGF